jgi:hypothetical protein
MTHPLAVVRAAQLQQWAASPAYRALLAGDYPRRTDDRPPSDWTEDLAAAARNYRDTVVASTDPLARVFTDVGEAMTGAAGRLWNSFGGRSGGADDA